MQAARIVNSARWSLAEFDLAGRPSRCRECSRTPRTSADAPATNGRRSDRRRTFEPALLRGRSAIDGQTNRPPRYAGRRTPSPCGCRGSAVGVDRAADLQLVRKTSWRRLNWRRTVLVSFAWSCRSPSPFFLFVDIADHHHGAHQRSARPPIGWRCSPPPGRGTHALADDGLDQATAVSRSSSVGARMVSILKNSVFCTADSWLVCPSV